MRASLGLAVATFCLAGAAFANAPASSPRPPVNPQAALAPASAAAPSVTAFAPLVTPRPVARPNLTRLAAVSGASVPAKVGKPGARGAVCGVPGITGVRIPPILSSVRGCGLEEGVKVTAISGIPLSLPATVDCATAKAFKNWVDTGIVPAVGNRGGGLARLEIAGSYTCRPRNNQKGAKISEHGQGRAIDLSGLRLADGRVISVERGWKTEARLLKAVHGSACRSFGTVLGPNSDRFHNDHIHVDTARHQNGSYCR